MTPQKVKPRGKNIEEYLLKPSLNYNNVARNVNTHVPACLENGHCEGDLCPLSRVVAGTAVRIKRLDAPPELTNRLREIGFCEEQEIKLVSRHTNLICLVCNARLGISSELADNILVQPVAAQAPNGTRAHAR